MPRLNRLPARFPADTKYVLEARGPVVHRFIEFPDGRKVQLKPRKAATCHCPDSALVPPMSPASDTRHRTRLVEAAA